MCGVACIFSYGPQAPGVNKEELLRIQENMFKRGPDSSGVWVSNDNQIGLAHRRLSILDISDAGSQPMLDKSTGNRIIFNGEIYNFRELKSHLESLGHNFLSQSDTEVLLKLYGTYGEKMLSMLRGMFAFVIWDETKKGIFVARDHFGIKPLYVADDGNTLRFASQVKALLAGDSIELSMEPAGHVGFLLWGYIPEPFTLFKGIRAVPAGTSIWVDSEGKQTYNEYFNLAEEYSKDLNLGKKISEENKKERLHEALLDTVQHHLISDVPTGVFLSAGLDSCSIANLAVESGERNLNTLTLGFEEFLGTENDEVPLAEMFSKYSGTRQQTYRISSESFSEQYDDLLDAMDQPSIDGVNTFFICKAAKEAGLKVALSGLGGDELFGGYSYFQKIPKIMSISSPFHNFPHLGRSFRKITSPFFKKYGSPKIAGLLEYGGDYAGAYLLSRSHHMPWEVSELLGKDLFKEGWDALKTLSALKQTLGSLNTDRTAISALELQWYMKGQLLQDSDWASMAHSVEVRVPFVDIKLFREVAKLIGSGFSPNKLDMATSCKNMLPQPLLNKPKTGFSIPVQNWLIGENQTTENQSKQDLKLWSEIIYKSFT